MKHGPAKQMINVATNYIANQMGISAHSCHLEKIVPDIKTIPAYERALDLAVITLFEDGAEDEIIQILHDAKENNCRIKEYISAEIEDIKTYNIYVRKCWLKIKQSKCCVKIFLRSGSITITPSETVITKQVVINEKLVLFVKSCQKSLEKIEKELKS